MKKITLSTTLVLVKLFAFTQQLTITNTNPPNRVGERMLTFQCPLDGSQQKDIEVWVYYSDNKEQLSQSDCPRGRATCTRNSSDNSKLNCRFYFPHSDHMEPNFILNRERKGGDGLEIDESISLINDLINPPSTVNINEYVQYQEKAKDYKDGITDKNPKSINNPKKVYYKIIRKGKAGSKASTVLEFSMPRLFIIGYMGDSYSSGEGAPYSGNKKWDDDFCHRSENSGGMLAINKLIKTHRELGTRVINTTCSGAKIENIISNPHKKDNKSGSRKPQLDQIAEWCAENNRETVDILLMGIGGNDIEFAPLATSAIAPTGSKLTGQVDYDWSDFTKLQDKVLKKLEKLPGYYKKLDDSIDSASFDIGKVLMMNYPNMLYGLKRKLCDGDRLNGNTSIGCLDFTTFLFTHIDFFREVHSKLNETITTSCNANEWELVRVSGINTHGICNCDEAYFNSITDSKNSQGDNDGAVHPNKDGYENLYKENVYAVLVANIKPAQQKAFEKTKEQAKEIAKQKLKKQLEQNRTENNDGENSSSDSKPKPSQNFKLPREQNK